MAEYITEKDEHQITFRSVSDSTVSHYACTDVIEANMREKDDELLERGVEDTCSAHSTPVLGPLDSQSALASLEDGRTRSGTFLESVEELSMLSGQAATDMLEIEAVLPRSFRGAAGTDAAGCQHGLGGGGAPCGTDNGSYENNSQGHPFRFNNASSILNESICTVDSIEVTDEKQDHALLSQSFTCSNNELPSTSSCVPERHVSSSSIGDIGRTGSSSVRDAPEEETDNETEQTSCSGREIIVYYSSAVSKSIDRRISEAAQFAEAIGEVPPTDESILPEIIEEDSSSSEYDEDQGATEVDVDLDNCTVSESIRPCSPTRSLSAMSENLPPLSPLRNNGKEKVTFKVATPIQPTNKPTSAPLAQDEVPLQVVITQSSCNGAAQHEETRTAPILPSLQAPQRPPEGTADEAAGPDCCSPAPVKPQTMKRCLWVRSKPLSKSTSMSRSTESLLNRISHEEGISRSEPSYVYRGIRHNPPEITKRGISRGNYAQLHRKAWLEVSDKYHRYGKNLRLYYKHWEKLGHPTNMFFDWIDSKGEAAGAPLPNLSECPRSQLDSDTVLYITNPELQARYALSVDLEEDNVACIVDADGCPINTGPEGWIFVLRDHVLYGSQKVTSITGKSKQRFHHSSFFGGKAVAAAGIIITDESGRLTRLYPHSGHYRPGEAHMQRMLYFLQQSGVDLMTIEVDMQQILHVARKEAAPKGGALDEKDLEDGKTKTDASVTAAVPLKKSKKVQSLKLQRGFDVACFLAHKALMIEENVFCDIHKIRKMGAPASVREVLDSIDDGGYWRKLCKELCEH